MFLKLPFCIHVMMLKQTLTMTIMTRKHMIPQPIIKFDPYKSNLAKTKTTQVYLSSQNLSSSASCNLNLHNQKWPLIFCELQHNLSASVPSQAQAVCSYIGYKHTNFLQNQAHFIYGFKEWHIIKLLNKLHEKHVQENKWQNNLFGKHMFKKTQQRAKQSLWQNMLKKHNKILRHNLYTTKFIIF